MISLGKGKLLGHAGVIVFVFLWSRHPWWREYFCYFSSRRFRKTKLTYCEIQTLTAIPHFDEIYRILVTMGPSEVSWEWIGKATRAACMSALLRWRRSEPRFASTSPRPWKRPFASGFIIFPSLLWWVATCNPLKSDEDPNSHQCFLFGVHGSTSRPGMANTLESPWSLEGTSWTSTASSSALWPRSPRWRRLRRSTLWCFWWMSRPPNPRSRTLWSSSTMWSAPRSTPSFALMGALDQWDIQPWSLGG